MDSWPLLTHVRA